MCGFTGIVNYSVSNAVDAVMLRKMTEMITHRGPDDEGYFVRQNIGFGFRRLSIIDLAGGHQPMSDHSGKYVIVFNGEIYNYRALKKDLEARGHVFLTDSDTEVVIALYKEFDFNCLHHLRGMFAFVIWDSIHNKIILARDRFGIKPLYYLLSRDGVCFASELKSISKVGGFQLNIDSDAVDSYFSYGYIMAPNTIYKEVKKLQAGHFMEIDLDMKIVSGPARYWRTSFDIDTKMSYSDHKMSIVDGLKDSVEHHLVSDVPVGAFLSGGIDSSAVVAMMAAVYKHDLHTFTVGFEEKAFNEADIAARTSQHFGTKHHQLMITKNSVFDLKAIIDMYDEPFADSSAIPTYFVSKLASEHVKVVLSGDGGDELFGGYGSYQRLLKSSKYQIPSWIRHDCLPLVSRLWPSSLPGKRFSYMLSHDPQSVYAYYQIVNFQEKNRMFNQETFNSLAHAPASLQKVNHLHESNTKDYLSRMMELDILTYLPDDILTKVDIASMANSIEVRVPILDLEFYKVASRVPSEFKVRDSGKMIFKEALKPYLPGELFSKPKRGFTIPINQWFKGDLDEFVKDTLSNNYTTKCFFNQSYIDRLKNTSNLGSLLTRVWPLVVFYNWHSTYSEL